MDIPEPCAGDVRDNDPCNLITITIAITITVITITITVIITIAIAIAIGGIRRCHPCSEAGCLNGHFDSRLVFVQSRLEPMRSFVPFSAFFCGGRFL